MASLGDMVVRIRGDMTDFNRAIDASETKFKAATANFQKLGMNLTKFVTLPILGIGAAAVKAAADMEMQEAAFETMLGSAEKAKNLLLELNTLAAKTPFQMSDLAESTKTMLAFGIAQEKVLPNLQMLGDIAGGNADKLRSLTLAFSQIQSTGRLMGQDLLQLINAGFNPLQTIAEKTGKTMAELKKDMENGAISADMVSEAFKDATSEGGRFFGGMERASLTLKGQFSTLLDNMVMLGRGLGDILLPPLKSIVSTTTEIVQKFTALDEATRTAVVQYGLLAAAVGPVILGVLQLIKILPQLKIAMAFLAANPIIMGMVALGAAIAIIAVESKKAATQAKAMSDALSGAADLEAIQQSLKLKRTEIEYQKTLIQQNENLGNQGKLAAASARQALAGLQAEERQLVSNLNGKYASIRATEEQNKAAIALAEAEANKARLEQEAAEARRVNDENEAVRIAEQLAASDALIAQLQEEITLKQAAQAEELAQIAEIREAKNESLSQDYQIWIIQDEFRQKLHQDELDRIEEEKQRRLDAARTIYGQIGSLVDQLTANEIARIEQSEDSEEEKAKKIAQVRVKQAKWDKAQALIDIAIQTAVAVTKALPNLVLAGIVGALGIAQGVAAAAQPLPPVPLAEGGIVMPTPGGTLAQIAEAGQPEAVIPLDRLGDLGGNIHLTVTLDSKPFLDKIFPATRNRQILISAGAVV